jgi:carbonic anhydrase
MWKSFALSLLLIVALVAMASEPCGPPPHFGYDNSASNGPFYWGSLKSDWVGCSNGDRQSPIDLRDETLRAPEMTITYGPMFVEGGRPMKFQNKGHDLEVYNANPANKITVAGIPYNFVRFHIHTPSEHTVAGSHYPAEIHFVNASGNRNAVLGVMVATTMTLNPQIQMLLDSIPPACTTAERSDRPINAALLLPPPANRGYFSYEGSLTTPGCDQTVTWFVLKTPIFATAQQIRRLREVFGDNARPIQDPRGRVVGSW